MHGSADLARPLAPEVIGELLRPYLAGAVEGPEGQGGDGPPEGELLDQLAAYLVLLRKWNLKMNLTSVRDPVQMVQRHFGESLFAARHMPVSGTLLDLGSGAGFPGLPIQLWRPGLRVTLAESQIKKASFLREVVRSLSLPTEVFAGRAEELVGGRIFDTVILRSVDGPNEALEAALRLSAGSVWLLGPKAGGGLMRGEALTWREFPVPEGMLTALFRIGRDVPRGTG